MLTDTDKCKKVEIPAEINRVPYNTVYSSVNNRGSMQPAFTLRNIALFTKCNLWKPAKYEKRNCKENPTNNVQPKKVKPVVEKDAQYDLSNEENRGGYTTNPII